MSGDVQVIAEAGTVTVLVPFRHRKRGGRKVVTGVVRLAGHSNSPPPKNSTHKTTLKAFGRAYRWKRMLESGEFNSITDLAGAEKINHSYVRRILRLTLVSPAITEAVLGGTLPSGQSLQHLLLPLPDLWSEQASLIR